jgi:uncharacterized protein
MEIKPTLAIIGSGLAGLACAYFLRHQYKVLLFEKQERAGGHTNTVTLTEKNAKGEIQPVPVDTGFMVFNPVTYPNLCRLFERLNVAIKPTDMSFSVQYKPDNVEWAGAGLNQLFGQRRKVVSPKHWRFLLELQRFNESAPQLMLKEEMTFTTVADFVKQYNYSDAFLCYYLLPMSSAIWSTHPKRVMQFPIRTLMRFFHNHGFLGLDTHYQWLTVVNGSKSYVEKLLAAPELAGAVQLNQAVEALWPVTEHEAQPDKRVGLKLSNGETVYADRAIVATHADEALTLLAEPTALQQELLSPFAYEENVATLHSDASVMPQRKRVWSAWNYRIRQNEQGELKPATHYWMNRLQGVSDLNPYFVSINDAEAIAPEKIHWQKVYHHPQFTPAAIAAQQQLSSLNTPESLISFCGSYFRYGFHEDALLAGLSVCKALLGKDPWAVV